MLCHGKAWVLGPLALHEAWLPGRTLPASQSASQNAARWACRRR